MSRSLTAELEERLLVPAYSSSRWAQASIVAHRSFSFPLQLAGPARRRTVSHDSAAYEIMELGREKLTIPICARLFGPLPPGRPEARRWSLSPTHLQEVAADLVIAEVHRWMAPRFRRNGWLVVPRSVRWQGDLASVPPVTPSRSLQANLAKLRRQNFSLVQGASAADWQEFFTTMVAPQAKTRHGSTAWVASGPFLRTVEEKGTLHFIVDQGVRVAGICTIPSGDTLWFPLMGVRNGDPDLLQRGAGVATLALPIEWARQNNYRRVDLGRTGPFVNDGLQQYKRRWGFVPVPDPLSLVTAVWVGSTGARRAFAREPVLIEAETGLETFAGETA